jgi:hypothetical protein
MAHNPNIPPQIYARVGGLLYLLIIVFGISGEVLIRSSLIVSDNANQTASNILQSQTLFRVGFVADSIMLLADVAIAVVFYVLLKPVNKILSLTAATFRLMQATILGLNLLNYYAALLLLTGAGYIATFEGNDLNSLAMFFLNLHSHGYDLGLIFFGVSNLILGYLVFKSKYFPAILGIGLIAAGMVYLSGSYVRFVLPNHVSFMEPMYIVPLIAELSFCLWLLIKGVRAQE